MDEQWANNPGCLTAWVEAGRTRAERNERLQQVPERYRDQVWRQVKTAFELTRTSNGSGGQGCDSDESAAGTGVD